MSSTDEVFITAPLEDVQRALLQLGAGDPWWPRARVQTNGGRLSLDAPAGRRFARVKFAAAISNIRPREGLTWTLERGELRGRGEWWMESFKNGTIVHYYLDVEPGDRGRFRRPSSRVRRHRWAIRLGINGLKDFLELRARAGAGALSS